MKYNNPQYFLNATRVVESGLWRTLLPFEYVLFDSSISRSFEIEESNESYEIAISGDAGALSGTGELVFDSSCESSIEFYDGDELVALIKLEKGTVEALDNGNQFLIL